MKLIIKLPFMLLFIHLQLNAAQYNEVLNIGDSLPVFNDLPTTDNKQISSSQIQEDVVVMVSLANHCPWVRGMDRDLIKLVNAFQGKSVRVIGFSVNLREDDRLEAMKAHAQKVGYNFTYLFDESQQLGRDLGATRTPEYFVFDKNRKLVYMGLIHNSPAKMNADGSIRHINGEPSEFYAEQAINATLNGQAVENAETRAHGCSVKYE